MELNGLVVSFRELTESCSMTVQCGKMEQRPPLSGVGTVVSGEASESDDDSPDFLPNPPQSAHGIGPTLLFPLVFA